MENFINDHVEAYIYQQAKDGNHISGDAYFIHSEDDYFICAIADGLGNGPIAHQSAQVIPDILKEFHHETVDDLLMRCNLKMMHKRGAAVAIVKVDYRTQTLQYSCVGNVRFYVLQDQVNMIYPLPVMGYLSGKPQKLKMHQSKYQNGDLFFLHSDGVVLKSPKSCLTNSKGPYALSQNVIPTINHNDDATFIAGRLLL